MFPEEPVKLPELLLENQFLMPWNAAMRFCEPA
jgi:hypothetical protein